MSCHLIKSSCETDLSASFCLADLSGSWRAAFFCALPHLDSLYLHSQVQVARFMARDS
ncbi:hypothetical protein B484DRAFT_459958 [Ochromonadaceae sp. CCMP2298]|nr:hypothetical protein B484DRAFT_459958 [Ochromonadaceae sp. CCMP2298]